MSDAPKTIWAREKKITRVFGVNTETEVRREWCEGYATQEIADTCNAVEYTLTASVAARLKAADELAEAITNEREMVCQDMGLQARVAERLEIALTAYSATKPTPD